METPPGHDLDRDQRQEPNPGPAGRQPSTDRGGVKEDFPVLSKTTVGVSMLQVSVLVLTGLRLILGVVSLMAATTKARSAEIVLTSLSDGRTVALSPDGTMIALSRFGTKILDAKTKQVFWTASEDIAATCAQFSPDSKFLFVATDGGRLLLYDIGGKALVRTFVGHRRMISTLDVSPDGALVAAGANQHHSVLVWDVKTGEQLCSFRYGFGNTTAPTCIRFDPQSKNLACLWANENVVTVWDAKSGKLIREVEPREGYVSYFAMQWLKDPDTVALGERSGRLLVVNLATKTIQQHLQDVHRGGVNAMAISADRHTLVTSGRDGVVKFWDTANWSNYASLKSGDPVNWVTVDGINRQFAFRREVDILHGLLPSKPKPEKSR